jgi:hypothetical protein
VSKINEVSLNAIKDAAKMRISMRGGNSLTDIAMFEYLVAGLQESDIPDRGKFYAQNAFTAIYSKIAGELRNLYKDLETVKNFYIVRVILDQVVDDTLAPTVGSDNVFSFSHKNEAINKELNRISESLALNKLVQNIAHDLCFYGNYALRTKLDYPKEVKADKTLNNKKFTPKPNGIKELRDDVEQGTLIKIDLGANEYSFLHYDEDTGVLSYHHPSDFIYFSLGGARIKARTDGVFPLLKNIRDEELKEWLEKIPKYVRVGKPYFYQMTDKLRELELMEKLLPAVKINKLTQGNLMSVRLPDSYSLEEGVVVANKLEQLVNKKVSVDPLTGQITVESILATAGRTKFVPQFGDKGTVDKFDTKADAVDDLSNVATELKNSILDSMGIPSELVYKSDNANKNETIKRYAKYLRKLKQLQKALADGLKQIAFIHLRAKGYNEIKIEDIEVNFLNALIEVDQLDKLEFTAATVNSVKDIVDFFVNNLAGEGSPFKENVDLNKLAEWCDTRFKFVGLSDVIKTAKEGGKSIEVPKTPPTEPPTPPTDAGSSSQSDDVGSDSSDEDDDLIDNTPPEEIPDNEQDSEVDDEEEIDDQPTEKLTD